MHSSLIGKVEKANRYARELDRITFDRLSLTFRATTTPITSRSTPRRGIAPATTSRASRPASILLSLQKILGVMLPEEAQVSIFSSAPAELVTA